MLKFSLDKQKLNFLPFLFPKKIILLFSIIIFGAAISFGNTAENVEESSFYFSWKNKFEKVVESISDFFQKNSTNNFDLLSMTTSTCPSLATTEIGGCIWEDYNSNGLIDEGGLAGVKGVEVNIYGSAGTLVTAGVSDSVGNYLVTGLTASTDYRVEFILNDSLSTWAQPTKVGTDNGSMVQFLQPGNCANLGLIDPSDYCSDGAPKLYTPCYVNGSITGTGYVDVLVQTDYDYTNMEIISNKEHIGSVWGLAVDPTEELIYSAAFLKRHVGLGPDSLGAIYTSDLSSGTPNGTLFFDLESVDDVGTIDQAARGLGNAADLNTDSLAFSLVGKAGLGGLALNSDYSKIYTVSLASKKVWAIPTDNPTINDTISYTIPNGGCSGGEFRPFAISYNKGKIYVGGICDASVSQDFNDLTATVYELDTMTGIFTSKLSFDLNFQRGWVNEYESSSCTESNQFNPWIDEFDPCLNVSGKYDYMLFPQPILSDIEFVEDGTVVLGFMDRTGHQVGDRNNKPDGSKFESVQVGGDILRVSNNNGTWAIENNGKVNTYTGALLMGDTLNYEGPGTGEFYYQDTFINHKETSLGGIHVVKGNTEVILTELDPTAYNENGFAAYSNISGVENSQAMITTLSGKANGLGDVDAFAGVAPIEVGHYVWSDNNGNGTQDAGEVGISGVNVQLYSSAGVLVASTTTDASGNYSFSHSNVVAQTWVTSPDSLYQNTDYYIVFGNSQFSSDELTVGGFTFALAADSINSGANRYAIDSDAKREASTPANAFDDLPSIEFSTGSFGQVDHSLDVGFIPNNLILPINDDENTLENIAVSGNILTNDLDPENNNITLTGVEDPANAGTFVNSGTLTTIPGVDESGSPVADAGDLLINTNGSYTFTPASGFTGVVEVSYKIIDNHTYPVSDDATLTIYVVGVPDVTATNENVTIVNDDENVTYENVAVDGNVMINDADPTNDMLTFSGFDDGGTPASYVNTGNLNDIAGTDRFGNPIANAGDFLISTNGDYTFTPETGFTGVVSLDYQTCDNGTPQACEIATLNIRVMPDANPADNDAPFAGDDFSSTALNTMVEGSFVINDADPNANSVSLNGTTINPAGAATSIGSYTTQQGGSIEMFTDGSYNYTPPNNYSGPDNYKYQVCDVTATNPQPLCDSATINMIVFPMVRDFSDLDSTVYSPAYNWGSPDADANNIPDGTDAFWFGVMVDYETTDKSSPMGNGDDSDGVNDDDGLATPASLPVGGTETFNTTINSNSAKTIHFGIWIDWTDDGIFEDFYANSGTTTGTGSEVVGTTINVPGGYLGGTVHIRQRAFSSAPVVADFSGNSLNGEVEDYVLSFAALPVELIKFEGKIENCFGILNWKTASEENFSHFEIQKSENGFDFETIGLVAATGGDYTSFYRFDDEEELTTAVIYYRLKMVDLDGSFEYSNVASMTPNCTSEEGLNIYPNPLSKSQGILNLEFITVQESIEFSIFDAKGVMVRAISFDTEKGLNNLSIDVSEFSQGTYLLVYFGKNRELYSQRFVVQN